MGVIRQRKPRKHEKLSHYTDTRSPDSTSMARPKQRESQQTATKPDSSGMITCPLTFLENVSLEAGAAADALLSNPSYSAPEKRQEENTSKEFLMKLTSMNAAKAAEEIRADLED